jgi:hypothetical protein
VGDAVIASVNQLRTGSPLWETHQKGTTIDW